ncbi:hypothetical protein [Streptomyces sp. NPDC005435]|uniref:hypothetical protein n=1 Tax=Streptomyces sp. NPDC005435 TaxID=3154464 RepID=UPI00345559A5
MAKTTQGTPEELALMTPTGSQGVPLDLSLVFETGPEPMPNCAECAMHRVERERAKACGDGSKRSDINVRLRRHLADKHAAELEAEHAAEHA